MERRTTGPTWSRSSLRAPSWSWTSSTPPNTSSARWRPPTARGTPKAEAEFQRLRLLLRDDEDGVGKVINALAYQVRKYPRRKSLKTELRYFRGNRRRMDYANLQARKLPIGSGVVEAANKTLVTVRMKRAGSRWTLDGGQAVLTFRSLSKSDRFDDAWELLAHTYKMSVEVPENVVPLRPRAA